VFGCGDFIYAWSEILETIVKLACMFINYFRWQIPEVLSSDTLIEHLLTYHRRKLASKEGAHNIHQK